MGATLKLANLWRVIREVDLQAIREAALTPFELWLIDDGFDQADRMRHWLSGGEQPIPAALRIVRPDDVALVSGDVLPAAAIVFTTRRGDYAPTFLPGSSSVALAGAGVQALALRLPLAARLALPPRRRPRRPRLHRSIRSSRRCGARRFQRWSSRWAKHARTIAW